MNSPSGIFTNVDTLTLALSVSHDALDSGKTKMELVKKEASKICCPFKWSEVLCVLALVCLCFVNCYYKRYDVMLTSNIKSAHQTRRISFFYFTDNSFIIL